MAADEALLRANPDAAILRIYGWARPTISIGYFQDLPETEVEVVRRWTGGGLVDHRADLTYSMIVPRHEAFAQERAQDSYRRIHEALREALAHFGIASQLTEAASDVADSGCFAGGWAEGDLLVDGRKVAGAAQRRSRFGLLHQGSLQLAPCPEGLWQVFAEQLADSPHDFEPPVDLTKRITELAGARYATREWLHRHRADRGE